MPIGPVSDSHREINVVEPISPAFEHVKRMLFKPFDIGKWFVIGFCAWLAFLGESGGGINGNFGGNDFNKTSHHAQENFQHDYSAAQHFVLTNLIWIIPAAAFLILFCLALWAVILWLNSRGKFMFLHCVALDTAEVTAPWAKYHDEGNSLFWFRVVLTLVGMVLGLPIIVLIAVLVLQMLLHGMPNPAGILIAIGLGIFFVLLAIVFAIIQKFTADFVVPIMYLRRLRCVAAWKEFYGLLAAWPGQFTLYILFQIVIGIAIAAIVFAAVILTCCIAGCLMAIPYIGTVLLLPVLIFKRSYSLYFLQQFGPNYDVFPAAPPPSPTPPPSGGLQPLLPAQPAG